MVPWTISMTRRMLGHMRSLGIFLAVAMASGPAWSKCAVCYYSQAAGNTLCEIVIWNCVDLAGDAPIGWVCYDIKALASIQPMDKGRFTAIADGKKLPVGSDKLNQFLASKLRQPAKKTKAAKEEITNAFAKFKATDDGKVSEATLAALRR